MNSIAEQLILLVKCAINETEPAETENIDWKELYDLASFHSITSIVASVIDKINMPDDIKNMFIQDQTMSIYLETNQEIAVRKLMDDFEREGIDHMPLKGFIIKHLYPSIEMRNMCDVDILIHEYEIDKIMLIMKENGFSFMKDSPHEFIFSSGVVTIELHKSLVPNYNKDLYEYYGDGWRIAKLERGYGHRYELSFEDFYVYNIVHTAKHYLNGGTGIRQVADIYVMRKSYRFANADKEYISNELKKLGLDRFARIITQLCSVWFENGTYNKNSRMMAEYIINSGVYGTQERANSSSIYRASGHSSYMAVKMKSFVKMLFPKREWIIDRYPILADKPQYYPIYVIFRWFDVLFNRRSNIKKSIENTMVPDEKVDAFAKHCEEMGLRKSL